MFVKNENSLIMNTYRMKIIKIILIIFTIDYLIDLIYLPIYFDWRSSNGNNYLSPLRNQYQRVENGTVCGICWGMATTSTIADRMNIYMGYNDVKNFLSVQDILDCIPYANACNGGNELDAYKYAMEKGIPHETCNMYKGYSQECNKENRCYPSTKQERLYVKGYERMINRSVYEIKKEIYTNGPITCAIKATEGLINYTSGIYSEYNKDINIVMNHVVSIIGWGYENYTEYYIVRNSWGYQYGEGGFFRIVTSHYKNNTGNYWNLGIEQDCSYPIMGEWRTS